MYLLYLDESGQHGGIYFVLAGVAVFERQTYWLSTELDRIQQQFLPKLAEPVNFHAADIRAGHKEPWSELTRDDRHNILDRIYRVIAESEVTLFAVAVERRHLSPAESEYQFSFESLTKRFDEFLKRRYKQDDDSQRGLIVIAESQFRERIETLALRIRREGTRWGQLYNLAEVPLFTLAANSRLLQLADFCANAVWGRYEKGLSLQFDKIAPRFDSDNGVIRGLGHFCIGHYACLCPACLTRRLRPSAPSV